MKLKMYIIYQKNKKINDKNSKKYIYIFFETTWNLVRYIFSKKFLAVKTMSVLR